MLNDEQAAAVTGLFERLEVELRNGDIPGATATMKSLYDFVLKTDLPLLDGFFGLCQHLIEVANCRIAMLELLPKFKELFIPPLRGGGVFFPV